MHQFFFDKRIRGFFLLVMRFSDISNTDDKLDIRDHKGENRPT